MYRVTDYNQVVYTIDADRAYIGEGSTLTLERDGTVVAMFAQNCWTGVVEVDTSDPTE